MRTNGWLGLLLGALALWAVAGCAGSEASPEGPRQQARQALDSGPDFVVTAVSGPSSLQPNQPLVATVTVCNQGTQPGGTGVNLFLSSDSVITPGDPATNPAADLKLGGRGTTILAPGQCQTLIVSGGASFTEGAYYLGAMADADNLVPELNEDNNTALGDRLGIGLNPDFVVTAVTAPATAGRGQSISVSATVCNQGTSMGSALVEVYLSSDNVITPRSASAPSPDTFVSFASTSALSPRQCQTVSMPGPVSVPTDGSYYVGAVADPQNTVPELIEDNNFKVSSRLIGIGNKPDLFVSALSVQGSGYLQVGQSLSTSVTVCSQASVAGSARVEVYLSSDTTITPGSASAPSPDALLGAVTTNLLGGSQCQTFTVSGPANVPAEGSYYVGAVVDPQNTLPELFEDNNTRVGSRVGIGNRPDFVVSNVSAPSSAQIGQAVSLMVTVCNRGTAPGSTPVEVYFSGDGSITPSSVSASSLDTLFGAGATGTLSPGACQNVTVQGQVNVSVDGPYYLGVVLDPQNTVPELIEDNNIQADTRIGLGSWPDFTVSSVTGGPSVQVGQAMSVTVTVCNKGTVAGNVSVALYLSSDSVITPDLGSGSPDSYRGSMYFSGVGPAQCLTQTASVTASSTAGSYFLGAVADPYGAVVEFFEDNNTKAGTLITVSP